MTGNILIHKGLNQKAVLENESNWNILLMNIVARILLIYKLLYRFSIMCLCWTNVDDSVLEIKHITVLLAIY